MKTVTTKQAQRLLSERGIEVSYPTIAQWTREGRFSGALLEETERGPVWRIPVESVRTFEPPKVGRPPDSQTEAAPAKPARKRKVA
jgi:hypothetical protein